MLTAGANQIVQYEPEHVAGYCELRFDLVNDDNGAVYNAYDLYLFASLADALWHLPHNHTNYPSAADMASHWGLTILSGGEVYAGWGHDGNWNPTAIYNAGGEPILDYIPWTATAQNPGQDTMALRLSLPLTQLDGDGDGWGAADPADYVIRRRSSPVSNLGVARDGEDTPWANPAFP